MNHDPAFDFTLADFGTPTCETTARARAAALGAVPVSKFHSHRLPLAVCAALASFIGVAAAAGVEAPSILDFSSKPLEQASMTPQPSGLAAAKGVTVGASFALHDAGAGGDLTAKLLAVTGDKAFWRVSGTDGSVCYSISPAATAADPMLTSSTALCTPAGDRPAFTPSHPMQISFQYADYDGAIERATAIFGFVADQIKTVGVVDSTGHVHSTPVINNTYNIAPPAIPAGIVTEIVGLDASDTIVYRTPAFSPHPGATIELISSADTG